MDKSPNYFTETLRHDYTFYAWCVAQLVGIVASGVFGSARPYTLVVIIGVILTLTMAINASSFMIMRTALNRQYRRRVLNEKTTAAWTELVALSSVSLANTSLYTVNTQKAINDKVDLILAQVDEEGLLSEEVVQKIEDLKLQHAQALLRHVRIRLDRNVKLRDACFSDWDSYVSSYKRELAGLQQDMRSGKYDKNQGERLETQLKEYIKTLERLPYLERYWDNQCQFFVREIDVLQQRLLSGYLTMEDSASIFKDLVTQDDMEKLVDEEILADLKRLSAAPKKIDTRKRESQ